MCEGCVQPKRWNILWKRASLRIVIYCFQLCMLIIIPFFLLPTIAFFGFCCHPMFFLAQASHPHEQDFALQASNLPVIHETEYSCFCQTSVSLPSSSNSPVHAKELKRRMKIDARLKIHKSAAEVTLLIIQCFDYCSMLSPMSLNSVNTNIWTQMPRCEDVPAQHAWRAPFECGLLYPRTFILPTLTTAEIVQI